MRDTAATEEPSGPGREDAAPARSLVPVATRPQADGLQRLRPSAAFLAHLIATAQQAPQTRARCRAAPADATAHYASAARDATAAQARRWSM